MKIIFITVLTFYYSLEIFILSQLHKNKNRINFKRDITSLISSSILLIIIYLFKISIPYIILIFFIISLLIGSFFGYYLDYYNKLKHFDRYLHGYDSFSFSLLFYFIIINFMQSGGSKIFRAFFISFLGITIGVVFEIIEFLTDIKQQEVKTHRTAMQKGLSDTDSDLIFNFIGSILGAVLAYFFYL